VVSIVSFQHRFDADPGRTRLFHFDGVPDADPTPSFTQL